MVTSLDANIYSCSALGALPSIVFVEVLHVHIYH
jgi:hypothetical protein